jgi:hypothetical protein
MGIRAYVLVKDIEFAVAYAVIIQGAVPFPYLGGILRWLRGVESRQPPASGLIATTFWSNEQELNLGITSLELANYFLCI